MPSFLYSFHYGLNAIFSLLNLNSSIAFDGIRFRPCQASVLSWHTLPSRGTFAVVGRLLVFWSHLPEDCSVTSSPRRPAMLWQGCTWGVAVSFGRGLEPGQPALTQSLPGNLSSKPSVGTVCPLSHCGDGQPPCPPAEGFWHSFWRTSSSPWSLSLSAWWAMPS